MDFNDFKKFSQDELKKISEDTWRSYIDLVKFLYINHIDIFKEWQLTLKNKEKQTEKKE